MNIHKSQLFWGSPGVQGFDPSQHDPILELVNYYHYNYNWLVAWNHGILFFLYTGKVIIPTDFHSIIFQRGRLKPPTWEASTEKAGGLANKKLDMTSNNRN